MSGQEGNGIPLAVASALVVLFLFCGISEYARLNLIAVGVRDAVQEAMGYDLGGWMTFHEHHKR